jgi:hypothetical protein
MNSFVLGEIGRHARPSRSCLLFQRSRLKRCDERAGARSPREFALEMCPTTTVARAAADRIGTRERADFSDS